MLVARVWRRAGLQPHRFERYMLSDGPRFESRSLGINEAWKLERLDQAEDGSVRGNADRERASGNKSHQALSMQTPERQPEILSESLHVGLLRNGMPLPWGL